MSNEPDSIFERKLRRADVLKLSVATAGSSLLAACGGEDEQAGDQAGGGAPKEERPPIGQEKGDLKVFEWAGYELPTYEAIKPYQQEFPKPKYTFLTSDDQALAKVRAGFRPELVHPCIGYVQDWVNMGVVEPFDPSLISHFPDLNPEMVKASQVDGKQYFIPADWGFSSPLYRGDKVEPEEESWSLFYDERYKGKISWWESPLENFVIAGYVNGIEDPWNMSADEIEEMKKFLISKKHVVRNFWSSQTDLDADIANGNIWIAYSWAGSYVAAKTAVPKGEWVYMEPKEGRLSWVCGFVLMKDAANYHHAHEYVDVWVSPPAGNWIISNYAYGHSNTKIDLAKVDPEFVELLHLDDPAALQEPRAHFDRYVANRKEYARAWDEVKAA